MNVLEKEPVAAGEPAATQQASDALVVRGVAKQYGAVRAIRHADLTVRRGEVHALVGENGAGKSTLIKIVSGAEQPDRGTVVLEGAEQRFGSTRAAMEAGISTVYQEPQLFDELTVAENVFLGRELRHRGRVDWRRQHAAVLDLLALVGLPASVATTRVGDLSVGVQQQVSIAKALSQDASVLILDEPSAILTDAEIATLFDLVRRLVDRGVAIIYISHRLDELFRIADRVTVMRDGRTLGTYDIDELTTRDVVELMVGGPVQEQVGEERSFDDAPALLEMQDLSCGDRFADVDLTVRAGETVVLYGLVGCGASDIAAAAFGMLRPTAGTVRIAEATARLRSPRDAQRLGVALLPANRKKQGIFAHQSIQFNIAISHLRRLSRGGTWVSARRERELARDMIGRLAVKTPHERQAIGAMSGGNAQKVVFARQLVGAPRVLILEEPTQGVDVGAKEEIHQHVAGLAAGGAAVLVVTTDLLEAQRLADRVLIVRDGRLAATFGRGASQADILAAAAAGDHREETS